MLSRLLIGAVDLMGTSADEFLGSIDIAGAVANGGVQFFYLGQVDGRQTPDGSRQPTTVVTRLLEQSKESRSCKRPTLHMVGKASLIAAEVPMG